MIENIATLGGLVAFVIWFAFIPYCLAGDDDNTNRPNEAGAIAWLVVAFAVLVVATWPAPIGLSLRWLFAVPIYFAIGFGWFLWRWRCFLISKRDKTLARLRARKNDWPGMTEADILKGQMPRAFNHKERIAGWVLLWPWSLAWTVLKWPWRLATMIADWARGLADRMAERIWNIDALTTKIDAGSINDPVKK